MREEKTEIEIEKTVSSFLPLARLNAGRAEPEK